MGPTMRQTVPFLFHLFGGNFPIRGFQTLEAKLPVRVKVEAASLSLRCPANLASATKNCPACRTNTKKLSYKKSMNMQRLIILDSCTSSDPLPWNLWKVETGHFPKCPADFGNSDLGSCSTRVFQLWAHLRHIQYACKLITTKLAVLCQMHFSQIQSVCIWNTLGIIWNHLQHLTNPISLDASQCWASHSRRKPVRFKHICTGPHFLPPYLDPTIPYQIQTYKFPES